MLKIRNLLFNSNPTDVFLVHKHLKSVKTSYPQTLYIEARDLIKDINMNVLNCMTEDMLKNKMIYNSEYCDSVFMPHTLPEIECCFSIPPLATFILVPLFEIKNSKQPDVRTFLNEIGYFNQINIKYDKSNFRTVFGFSSGIASDVVYSIKYDGEEIYLKPLCLDMKQSAYFILYNSERDVYMWYVGAFVCQSVYEFGKFLNISSEEHILSETAKGASDNIIFELTLDICCLMEEEKIRGLCVDGYYDKIKLSLSGITTTRKNYYYLVVKLTLKKKEQKICFEVDKYFEGNKLKGDFVSISVERFCHKEDHNMETVVVSDILSFDSE
ncbi:hypothetical protein CDIK_1629 [Cucumispora dikerogammari]|nr:hypothetical protein CDIK_1629 [Cucumispora dikerogammari]